jgi:hypothetical protein
MEKNILEAVIDNIEEVIGFGFIGEGVFAEA